MVPISELGLATTGWGGIFLPAWPRQGPLPWVSNIAGLPLLSADKGLLRPLNHHALQTHGCNGREAWDLRHSQPRPAGAPVAKVCLGPQSQAFVLGLQIWGQGEVLSCE